MDDATARRLALRQPLIAGPEEASAIRMMGLDPRSPTGQALLRSLAAIDSQMSTLALSDEAFTSLRVGQRVYASVTSGSQTRAGWLQKTGKNTAVLNDGARDLLRSEIHGSEVLHYSLRSGRSELFGRTLKGRNSLTFETWDSETGRYLTTGFAEKGVDGAWHFYSIEEGYTGRLFVRPIGVSPASALPQSSVAIPLGLSAGAILALGSIFTPSDAGLTTDCSYSTLVAPHSRGCDQAILSAFAERAQRIGYTVSMSDGSGIAQQTSPTRDPNFSVKWR
jgi:hypothetical protein